MNEPLNIRWSRALPDGAKPSSVTVSKDCADRYFISIQVEEDIEHLPLSEQNVGADLGLKSFVALSTGEMVGNPKCFAQDEKKLARAQRRHAKKKRGSKNRDKARKKVARLHARIADRRRDFLHKLSTMRDGRGVILLMRRSKDVDKAEEQPGRVEVVNVLGEMTLLDDLLRLMANCR